MSLETSSRETEEREYRMRAVIWLSGLLLLSVMSAPAQAESLFHARATYIDQMAMSPRSLITPPRPKYVGDLITVRLEEQTIQQTQFIFNVTRQHEIQSTGAGVLNAAIDTVVNKANAPGNRNGFVDRLSNILAVPTLNGIDDEDTLNNMAMVNRSNRLSENVTCQVVEVMPNGNLVIQGRKAVMMAKERTDLYLTGIVNPFFIDNSNVIASTQVGNLQFLMGGQGVISRTQNDGVLTKVMQWLR